MQLSTRGRSPCEREGRNGCKDLALPASHNRNLVVIRWVMRSRTAHREFGDLVSGLATRRHQRDQAEFSSFAPRCETSSGCRSRHCPLVRLSRRRLITTCCDDSFNAWLCRHTPTALPGFNRQTRPPTNGKIFRPAKWPYPEPVPGKLECRMSRDLLQLKIVARRRCNQDIMAQAHYSWASWTGSASGL